MNAGYMALHNWVRRHKQKTGICEECGDERRTDWANISGEYRRDLADFRELCRPCHRLFDHGPKTHYSCGHPCTPENNAPNGARGYFICRICKQERERARRARLAKAFA